MFLAYRTHPWLSKVFKKLKPGEISDCLSFIRDNESLNKGEFGERVNRLALKNWSGRAIELLLCCNSA